MCEHIVMSPEEQRLEEVMIMQPYFSEKINELLKEKLEYEYRYQR